jgi:sigma-B regulation protein RsbU (phosphoserine phosphatase)
VQIDVFEMMYRSDDSLLNRPPAGARPRTALTMMEAGAYGPVRSLQELAPPKIDATHLSKLISFSGELLAEADPEKRPAMLCELMTGKQFNGSAVMLLRVARHAADAEPEVLHGPVLQAGQGEAPHVSRSVIKAVVAGESAVLASTKRAPGKDMVQMSMAASGPAISAVACPVRTEAAHMDVLYVMFPGQYGTVEWLALVSLAASLYRQADDAWAAREAAQAKALLEEELRRASEIQMRLVPKDFSNGDLDIGFGFVPSKGVGGDYVDALPTADGRVLVTVMDVAGKGMDAALIASGLHTTVHLSIRQGLSLVDIVQTLNTHLIDTWFASTSVTVAAAMIDPRTGRIEAVNCGHPMPLIIDANGRTRDLKAYEEVPLGLMEFELKVGVDRLAPGEMLALYSDGLSELFDEQGEMLGVEGVTRYLGDIHRVDRAAAGLGGRDAAAQEAGGVPRQGARVRRHQLHPGGLGAAAAGDARRVVSPEGREVLHGARAASRRRVTIASPYQAPWCGSSRAARACMRAGMSRVPAATSSRTRRSVRWSWRSASTRVSAAARCGRSGSWVRRVMAAARASRSSVQ